MSQQREAALRRLCCLTAPLYRALSSIKLRREKNSPNLILSRCSSSHYYNEPPPVPVYLSVYLSVASTKVPFCGAPAKPAGQLALTKSLHVLSVSQSLQIWRLSKGTSALFQFRGCKFYRHELYLYLFNSTEAPFVHDTSFFQSQPPIGQLLECPKYLQYSYTPSQGTATSIQREYLVLHLPHLSS